MIAVTYLGPKPQRVVEFPIPLIALSERTGERVEFYKGVPQPLAEHLAEQLRAFPEVFHVEPPVKASVVAPPKPTTPKPDRLALADGKRFGGKAGKWNAKAYIKKHKLEAHVTLARDAYGWILKLNEPAPITLTSVGQEANHGGDSVGNGHGPDSSHGSGHSPGTEG